MQTTGYVDERRGDHPDGYMVVLGTPESRASVSSQYGEAEVGGRAVAIEPPGDREVGHNVS